MYVNIPNNRRLIKTFCGSPSRLPTVRRHAAKDAGLQREPVLFIMEKMSPRLTEKEHTYWMDLALREAEVALRRKEVPIGAVIVKNGAVIGKGSNQTEMLQDPTAHAEIIAITAAAAHLGSRRLDDCSLYVTLEPCPMCAGAIVLARLGLLVFGSYDPKAGACTTLYTITNDTRLNHRVHTVGGVGEEKCSSLLREFFAARRTENGPAPGRVQP